MGDLQTVPLSEVIARLRTSAQGLSTAQAAARLRRDGPNEITQKPRSPLLEFARYLWAPIPWMIEAAGPASGRDGLGRGVAHAPATAACGSASTATIRNARRTFAASSSVPHRLANAGSLSTHCSPIPNPLGELAAAMLAKRVDAERRQL
jgi:Cation transporter/ATPase, N-terminus